MDLGEQLRPKSWDEIIGQTKAVRQIRAITQRRGHAGTCWWLLGPSGVGKTSMARILASEYSNEILTEESVGRDLLAEAVRSMMKRIGQPTLCGNRVWIVNEAQDIPGASITLLLDALEQVKVSKYDMIIFTAMESHERIVGNGIHHHALVTRCYVPEIMDEYSPEYRRDVLAYLERIGKTQHLDGPDVKRIAEKAKWSIRGALAALEMEGVLFGPDVPVGPEKTSKGKQSARNQDTTSDQTNGLLFLSNVT